MKDLTQLKDEIRKVRGLPPYDGFNTCYGDSYMWKAIRGSNTHEEIQQAEKEIRDET